MAESEVLQPTPVKTVKGAPTANSTSSTNSNANSNSNVNSNPEAKDRTSESKTIHVQRNKLEEIFVWKVSDELKLTVQEEKKFSQIILELSKKKNNLNNESQEIISQLTKLESSDDKQRELLLKKYRNITVQHQLLNTIEFDQVRKVLGAKRMARYLSLKLDITNRVKSLLSVEKNERASTADNLSGGSNSGSSKASGKPGTSK